MRQLDALVDPIQKGNVSVWVSDSCESTDSEELRAWAAKPIVQMRPGLAAQAASARFPIDWQWACLIASLVIMDALAAWASLSLAYDLRISSGLLGYYALYDPANYKALALLAIPIYLLSAAFSGLYKRDNLLGGLVEYQQLLKVCTTSVIGLVILSFLWRDFQVLSRGWLVLAWSFSIMLFSSERFLARRVASELRRRGWLTERVLIVGANDQGVAMATQWLQSPTSGMHVVGFLDDFKPIGSPVVEGLKVIGRPTALNDLVRVTGAREVVVVPTAVAWETLEKVITGAKGTDTYALRVSPGFYEVMATGIAVTTKTFVPLFTVNETRLVGIDALAKLAVDYLLGILLSVVLAPAIAAIALALKLSDYRSPVLQRHQIIGQCGRIFTMYKFRNSSCPDGGFDKAGCTELERWLYRTGLDKAPQLFNVLRGEMSLVGPRPHTLGRCVANPMFENNVRTVKPGLTGPWTVSGYWKHSDETHNDLYYVRNWTIWLDVQILFQSLRSWLLFVFRRDHPDQGHAN